MIFNNLLIFVKGIAKSTKYIIHVVLKYWCSLKEELQHHLWRIHFYFGLRNEYTLIKQSSCCNYIFCQLLDLLGQMDQTAHRKDSINLSL